MADSSGGLRFISLAEREEVYSFQAGSNRIIDLAFTADGANLLTLSEDGAVRLWACPGERIGQLEEAYQLWLKRQLSGTPGVNNVWLFHHRVITGR